MKTDLTTTLQDGMTQVDGNRLVLYRSTSLNLIDHVQPMKIPVGNFNPESVVVSNGDMYVGGFNELEFDGDFIWGASYLSYWHSESKENPDDSSTNRRKGFLTSMMNTVFGEVQSARIRNSHVRQYQGRNYEYQTGTQLERHILFYRRDRDEFGNTSEDDAMQKLKSKFADVCRIAISNELLEEIFNPVSQGVKELYMRMRRF